MAGRICNLSLVGTPSPGHRLRLLLAYASKGEKTMKKLLYVLLFTFLLTGLLFAAGKSETTETSTMQIEDTTGNIAQLADIPERITFAGKSANIVADVLYMFPEASERIVGTGTTNQRNGDFIEMLDPLYNSKTYLERNAGPEQIAATKPDLVIMKNFLKKSLGSPIAQLDIPVLYLNLETPEYYAKDFEMLGKVFNNEKRASELISYYKNEQKYVTDRTNTLTEKPAILFIYHTSRDGIAAFNIPPESWIQTKLVEMAGGTPVWTDVHPGGGWSKVNMEQIAAWNPDQIYLVAYKEDVKKVLSSMYNSAEWKELKAVKNKQLKAFPVDYYSWDQPDSRWILGLNWLAQQIHPELFKDLDLKEKAEFFFKDLYYLSDKQYKEEILSRLGW